MDLLASLESLEISSIAIFCYVTIGFLIAIVLRRNDIADIMWGPGIAIAAHTAIWTSGIPSAPQLLLLTLITVWALRLSIRIARKNLRKPDEDARYKRWRETWKYFYLRSYLQVFILQGALMVVLAYPAIRSASTAGTISDTLMLVGTFIWIVGFFFETVGDAQLDRFIKNPDNTGKLMQSGLWRYSRHPNYFGEITMWWAIGLLTLPFGILVLISPITITLLIRYVSGVPLLEAHFKDHPDWAEYERKTSMLVPLLPKN